MMMYLVELSMHPQRPVVNQFSRWGPEHGRTPCDLHCVYSDTQILATRYMLIGNSLVQIQYDNNNVCTPTMALDLRAGIRPCGRLVRLPTCLSSIKADTPIANYSSSKITTRRSIGKDKGYLQPRQHQCQLILSEHRRVLQFVQDHTTHTESPAFFFRRRRRSIVHCSRTLR